MNGLALRLRAVASDVATLFRSSPRGVDIVDMPGGDDEVVLFDTTRV